MTYGKWIAAIAFLPLLWSSAAPHAVIPERRTVRTTAYPTQDSIRAGTRGHVIVHAWPGNERLAAALVAPPAVLAPLPGLPDDALDQPPPIHIWLAPDPARFDSLTGGRSPEWGAGIAIPETGTIVLPGYASQRGGTTDLPRILRHELAHIALHRYLESARIPRWFSEGYATWVAGQLDADAAWLLRLAFLTRRAPPLDSLTLDWPRGEVDARVAYLLAASAVEYLYNAGGERAFRIFLERWHDSGDIEDALRDTHGLNLSQLERYWGDSVRKRYGWVLFAAQAAVIWTVAGFLVFALYLVRRRRNRARLARLRAAEIPDDPAYWLGEDGGAERPVPPKASPGTGRGDEDPVSG